MTAAPGLALYVALLACVVLALTTPGIPIVWDEGEYLWRSDQVSAWFGLLTHAGRTGGGWSALSPAVIHEYWHFVTWDEGHPSWGAVPLALGTTMFGHLLHPLTAARLGTVAVYSL